MFFNNLDPHITRHLEHKPKSLSFRVKRCLSFLPQLLQAPEFKDLNLKIELQDQSLQEMLKICFCCKQKDQVISCPDCKTMFHFLCLKESKCPICETLIDEWSMYIQEDENSSLLFFPEIPRLLPNYRGSLQRRLFYPKNIIIKKKHTKQELDDLENDLLN